MCSADADQGLLQTVHGWAPTRSQPMHRGHLTGWVPSAVAHLKLSPFQQQRLRCLPTTRHIQFDYSTQITPTLLVLQLNSRHTSHSMSSRQVAKASALPHCPAPVSVVSFFTPDNHNTAQHRAHTRHIVRWRVAQLGGGGNLPVVAPDQCQSKCLHAVWAIQYGAAAGT